jgi:hypothetical protein
MQINYLTKFDTRRGSIACEFLQLLYYNLANCVGRNPVKYNFYFVLIINNIVK